MHETARLDIDYSKNYKLPSFKTQRMITIALDTFKEKYTGFTRPCNN
jgi:hypothetical protein